MQNFVVIGTNHKRCPIDLRGKVSFSAKRLNEALSFLRNTSELKEALVLSTCNRVEIYAACENPNNGMEEAESFITRYHEIDRRKIAPYLYGYSDIKALHHLLSVASGLDSLVLGETQIMGQVKASFRESENAGLSGRFLKSIFCGVQYYTEKVRRETDLFCGKVSVGSVAVDFIKERKGAISNRNILIVGTGKVAGLLLQYIKEEKPNVVFVANRTFKKAEELARLSGGVAVRFENLGRFLEKADVIISATASPHFVINKEMIKKHTRRELLILDMALPRDVDPEVEKLENVNLFQLEDLRSVIKRNREARRKAAGEARSIIEKAARELWEDVTGLEREGALSR